MQIRLYGVSNQELQAEEFQRSLQTGCHWSGGPWEPLQVRGGEASKRNTQKKLERKEGSNEGRKEGRKGRKEERKKGKE